MSREKFEAWWVSENDGHQPRSSWSALRTDDGYNDEDIDLQWQGYQAATASMQSERDHLAAQLADVVAENAALKALNEDRRVFIMNGVQLGYIKVPTVETDPALETIRVAVSPQEKTPATDRFIAELGRDVDAANARVDTKCAQLCNQDEDIEMLRQRIAELEARTLTVKLPVARRVKLVSGEYIHGWTAYEVTSAIVNAGIKLQIEGE